MNSPKLTAIIFATTPPAHFKLWGMALYEKILRQLSDLGIKECKIVFDHDATPKTITRSDFARWHSIEISSHELVKGEIATLKELSVPGESVMIIRANYACDSRVLKHLKDKARVGEYEFISPQNTLFAFTCSAELIAEYDGRDDLVRFVESCKLTQVTTEKMETFIPHLRKKLTPYVFEINDENTLRKTSISIFQSVYKGATDFVTKFVYPTPIRWAVNLVSRSGITPNQITVLSMFLSFGAIPLFFTGWFWTAFWMGLVMSFLDTLDGKLARLTMRVSKSGDLLDHVSDVVYLAIWYIGLGWYLSDGELLNFENSSTAMTWLLVSAYFADRIVTGLFERIYGTNLHDFGRLDYVVRIFIARRNPFLVVLLLGLLLNSPLWTLYAITWWQALSFLFHLYRFFYLPLSGKKHRQFNNHGD